jgi:N-carbamoyl-L-amino-acid hydrolase
VAALAAVRALRQADKRLRHPIEVINFSAEEATVGGGTFGSRAMAGLLDAGVLEQVAPDGRRVSEHIAGTGLDPESVTRARRPPGDLAAYLELHVEQGGVLESSGARIGLVEGIVGIRRFQVAFEGEANHAGTTPMEGRRDALVSAAPFVTAVRDVALAHGIVGTVGALRLKPNSPNVVPGEVVLSAEIRGLDEEALDRAEEELAGIAAGYRAAFERTSYKPPAVSDPVLLDALEAACKELDLTFKRMPSGAGHDAMCMDAITRQAMLFVPSRNGVSHSPDEYTDPESCVAGACVLLAALARLDAELDASSGASTEDREGIR